MEYINGSFGLRLQAVIIIALKFSVETSHRRSRDAQYVTGLKRELFERIKMRSIARELYPKGMAHFVPARSAHYMRASRGTE